MTPQLRAYLKAEASRRTKKRVEREARMKIERVRVYRERHG